MVRTFGAAGVGFSYIFLLKKKVKENVRYIMLLHEGPLLCYYLCVKAEYFRNTLSCL